MSTRSQWSSSTGFILSAVGSAIGLGTIWRFPYLASANGGGIFLFAYLVVCLILGLTFMATEMALGRMTQKSAIGAFCALTKHKGWRSVGILNVATCWLVVWFYNIVGGWVLFYLVKSCDGTIPFTPTVDHKVLEGIFTQFVANPVEPLIYCAIFTFTTLLIVTGGIKKGIEKFSKILLPLRLVLMLILMVRAVTLPGAMEGIRYFLWPDFSKLSMSMLLEVVGLGFFTLSLAMGIILTYGSYASPKTNLFNSAKWTALLTVLACFLAGLIVLPAVFAFGVDPASGPGLVFIVMPAIFGHMPFGMIFAILFFAVLYFAAQMSAVSLLETLASFWIDEFSFKRSHATWLSVAVTLPFGVLLSLSLGIWSGPEYQIFGKTLFDLADYVTFCVMLPIGGILLSLFAGWIIWEKLADNLKVRDLHPFTISLFKNAIRFFVPLLILVILIQSNWPIA